MSVFPREIKSAFFETLLPNSKPIGLELGNKISKKTLLISREKQI